jgi:hypothetical protein
MFEQEANIQRELASASLVYSSVRDAASERLLPPADAGAISPSTDRVVAPSFKLKRM